MLKARMSRAAALRLLLIVLIAIVPITWALWVAHAATRTWTGLGLNDPNPALRNVWSNPANWSSGIPGTGDDLVFPSNAPQLLSNNNLAAGTAFHSITINGQQLVGHDIGLTHLTGTSGVIQFSIKLTGNPLFDPQAPGNIVVTSPINTDGRDLVVSGEPNATLAGVISNTGGLIFSPVGGNGMTLTADNTYTGDTKLDDGRLRIEGNQASSKVIIEGGTLQGSGRVGAISVPFGGGKVSPGGGIDNTLAVSGDVSLGNFTLFEVDKRGPSGNLQFGQLDVTGEVILNNPQLSVIVSAAPAAGETFTIINNDGTDAIRGSSGIFNGQPEGSTFVVGSTTFSITYKGGDGNNDVVLHVPTTRTWDGGGADNKWTTAANWDNDTAPGVGDALIFPENAARKNPNTNDFVSGTTFASLTFSGSGYDITGNAIALAKGITVNVAGNAQAPVFGPDISLKGSATHTFQNNGSTSFITRGQVELGGSALIVDGSAQINLGLVTGAVTGAGGITKNGAGSLVLEGSGNSYTGLTQINAGFVVIGSAGALGATGAGNNTIVAAGATLRILVDVNVTEAITLNGDGPNGSGALQADCVSCSVAGAITLATSSSIGVHRNGGSPNTLTLNGAIGETGGSQSLTKVNDGTLVLNAAPNSYSGGTTISAGRLRVNGTVPQGAISNNGGTLEGLGTVGAINATGSSAGIRPGNSNPEIAGTLNAGNVTVDGARLNYSFTFDANNNPQLSQLNVAGAVSLINASCIIGLVSAGPTPAFPSGTNFILINNDGTDPISGSFVGLPEGIAFPLNGQVFGLTYRGGDGNDLVLHVQTTRTWDGGGTTNNWSDAANWVGDVGPSPGDDLVFPSGAARLTNSNDFPGGTSFNSITFSGAGYSILGSGISLTGGVMETVTSGANNSVSVPIKLNANQTFSTAGPGGRTLSFAGVDTNGKLLTLDGSGPCNFALLSGAGGIIRSGTGLSVLSSDSTFTGSISIVSGTLRINGNQSQSAVSVAGGVLSGAGTTGPITASGGKISPEGLLNILTVSGNVMFNGSTTFETVVRGGPSNRQFDRLHVNGVVNLGGAGLSVIPSPPLPTGDTFTVIDNDGADPVNGTFNGLPEGAIFTAGSQPFKISYAGGDGNDVVLTSTPPPNVVQFSASNYSVQEDCTTVTITVNRVGDTSGAVSVNYNTSDGSATERRDYITALGLLSFAAGETSKSVAVLINEDSLVEGNETFNLNLSNPSGVSLGGPAIATITITDDAAEPAANPIDDARNYVCQNYHDFLNRQPDQGGWDFWTNQIAACGADAQCIEVQRVNVSASFFLSIEFQETGYLVERSYKTAFGDITGTSTFGPSHQLPVPIVRLNEFLTDTQQITKGVIVLQTGWEQLLENNKQAFFAEFVQRSRFMTALPATMTPAEFVDRLNQNAGNVLSPGERTAAINLFGGALNTTNNSARAQALRQVVEDQDLQSAESNRAFVLMEYLGYLRRNPNDPQDTDYTGYDFWLTKLNQFNGNYINAEMVKAFITSIEYRQRFGP